MDGFWEFWGRACEGFPTGTGRTWVGGAEGYGVCLSAGSGGCVATGQGVDAWEGRVCVCRGVGERGKV